MKRLYIVLLVLSLSFHVKAQELNGTYVHKSTTGSIELYFWGKNFSQINTNNNTGKTEGNGTYECKNSNLILYFSSIKEQDTSAYKMRLDKSNNPKIVHWKKTNITEIG